MSDQTPGKLQFAGTAQAIAWHARHAPDASAIVEMGERFSYLGCARMLAGWVRYLEVAGVRPGMLVGVEIGPRRPLHLMLFLACEVIGATAAAFAQTDRFEEDPVLPGCDLLVLTSPPAQRYPQAAIIVPAAVPDRDDWLALERLPEMSRIVRISRTSGSTGRQKAVPISYEIQQRIVNQRWAYLPATIRRAPRLLCLYRLGVRAFYTRVYMTLQAGGTVVFAAEEQAPALLQAGAINWLPMILGHAEAVARQTARVPPGTAILVEPIGARTSQSLRNLITGRLGAEIHSNYSSNEVNTIAYIGEDDVGVLCSGVDVRIVDDSGRDLPAGEIGMICVRTTTMADGYWNDPALTATAFVDGWYRTADSGFVPEPGKIVVLGRADDMLNIGGIKLPPAPIEDEIRQIGGVLDAVLLTTADAGSANALVVAVELDPVAVAESLRPRIDRIVARYVRSFHLFPLPSFPRTENGKIRRGEIDAAFRRQQR